MGIPGMFGTLEGQGVFKRREHQYRGQGGMGHCIVFDDATLPQLIMHEWRRQPPGTSSSGPAGFNPSNGGWLTQFRAFASCYIKQLVQEYNCTIVRVRHGGMNDKLNTINDGVYETLALGCAKADSAMESTGGTANRGTLELVSELCWPKNGSSSIDEAVLEAFGQYVEGSTRYDVRVVSAAANCADGEAWRQAASLTCLNGNQRKTFIVSCDTDVLFFRESSPDVGIVLLSSVAMDRKYSTAPVFGVEWSCILFEDTASYHKLPRFTYCTVADDVANALGVDARFMPILAACLGGDLSVYDPSVYGVTVRIKSALVNDHFGHGSAAAQALYSLAHDDSRALGKRMRVETGGRSMRACPNRKYCRRSCCEYSHPRGGELPCNAESAGGQCSRPLCRFRHAAPMAFEIAPYALEKYGLGSKFPHREIFQTWAEAVERLANMQAEHTQSYFGIGRMLPIG